MKFHHIHLRCQNLKAARDFYVEVMGAQELKHYFSDLGNEIYFLKFFDVNLALTPANYPGADPAQAGKLGMYHIGMVVDELDELVAGLQAKGAKLRGGIVNPTPNLRAAFIEAPDGMEIELMYYI